MATAIDVAPEVTGSATALAGLILVFLGAVSTSFDSYQKQEQRSVKDRYQARAGQAFAGFVLALLSACSALLGKYLSSEWLAFVGLVLLGFALVAVFVAAYSALRDIK